MEDSESKLLNIFQLSLGEDLLDELNFPVLKVQLNDDNFAIWKFAWIERKYSKNDNEKILCIKLDCDINSDHWTENITFNFLIKNSSQMFFVLKSISGIQWKNESTSTGIDKLKMIAYSKMNLTLEIIVFKEKICDEISTLKNQSKILSDFLKLLKSSHRSDLKIITHDGKVFNTHKLILCTRSKYFDRLFSSDADDEIEKFETKFDSAVIENLLRFIYTEEFSEHSHDDYMKLYEAAMLYEIENLPEK